MEYQDIITKNMNEEIETLQDLLMINSEGTEPVRTEDGVLYPFGSGVQTAFEYTLSKAQEMGFEVENIDNYGGHIDFGEGDEIVGVIGHLDVVPAGEGWAFDPYSGAVSNGYIYGRGTTDDKGPVVAVLYAMKALKDSGYVPGKKIRLILGLDEETAWNGLDYYLKHVKELPDFGFTPDGEFPVVNAEKGIMNFDIVKKIGNKKTDGLMLSSFEGGSRPNMVPESARAVVYAEDTEIYDTLRDFASIFVQETDYDLKVRGLGRSLELTATGKSAHGANPQDGINAISIMMSFFGRLNFGRDTVNEFVDFYNRYLGFDVNGEKIGCGFEDEASGKLTLNVGLISMEDEDIRVTVNVRYPISKREDEVYDAIMPVIIQYDMGIVKKGCQAPIFMDVDNPMVKALMTAYEANTADFKVKPIAMGGGTYARAFKNMLAFGALFPGDPDIMHQRDEKLALDRFETMTRIYADALYDVSSEEFSMKK